jgi:hypothetical protein
MTALIIISLIVLVILALAKHDIVTYRYCLLKNWLFGWPVVIFVRGNPQTNYIRNIRLTPEGEMYVRRNSGDWVFFEKVEKLNSARVLKGARVPALWFLKKTPVIHYGKAESESDVYDS